MNYYLFYTLFLLLNPLSLIFFCIIILSTSSILLCSFTLKKKNLITAQSYFPRCKDRKYSQ